MEHSSHGEAGASVVATVVIIALLALSACAANPAPRSYAQTGVPSTYTRQIHDAAYYTGADPAFPRAGQASGSGAGGE